MQYSEDMLQKAAGATRHTLLKEHAAILQETCSAFTDIPEVKESVVVFVPSTLNENNNLLGNLKI